MLIVQYSEGEKGKNLRARLSAKGYKATQHNDMHGMVQSIN